MFEQCSTYFETDVKTRYNVATLDLNYQLLMAAGILKFKFKLGSMGMGANLALHSRRDAAS